MKFNWGTGLFLFLVVFVILCIIFMYFAFHQNINLVQEGYYEKGADFDNERKTTERSALYREQISIENINQHVVISFPDSFAGKINNGEVLFYRPSDNNLDIHLKLNSDTLVIPSEKLKPGRYIVKVSWSENKEPFLIEKEFSVK